MTNTVYQEHAASSFKIQRRLRVAVPDLYSYRTTTGIGRVFSELCRAWGSYVIPLHAELQALPVPFLRNFPYAVRLSEPADLVFLPKLTGALALRNTAGLSSLVVVHDIGVVDELSNDREFMDWFSYQSVRTSFFGLKYASHIIVDSFFTRDRLLHYLPELAEQLSVVYPGVNEHFLNYDRQQDEARANVERILGTSHLGSPLIVYVGSELPRKNVNFLLQVFARIAKRFPGAQLLKVGSAGQARWRAMTLRCIAQLGLVVGKDVVFLDHVDDPLLADIYRTADVFASASRYEGFGLPALEAMAVGTPVVVSDRGSLPEVVGNGGRVATLEVEQFVNAIEEAMSTSSLRTASRQGIERAAQFRWHIAAEHYLDVMDSMAHNFGCEI
jgi:glycosyltransferase involved in cell wall biosynthesis